LTLVGGPPFCCATARPYSLTAGLSRVCCCCRSSQTPTPCTDTHHYDTTTTTRRRRLCVLVHVAHPHLLDWTWSTLPHHRHCTSTSCSSSDLRLTPDLPWSNTSYRLPLFTGREKGRSAFGRLQEIVKEAFGRDFGNCFATSCAVTWESYTGLRKCCSCDESEC
jgi:hypothetical protein